MSSDLYTIAAVDAMQEPFRKKVMKLMVELSMVLVQDLRNENKKLKAENKKLKQELIHNTKQVCKEMVDCFNKSRYN